MDCAGEEQFQDDSFCTPQICWSCPLHSFSNLLNVFRGNSQSLIQMLTRFILWNSFGLSQLLNLRRQFIHLHPLQLQLQRQRMQQANQAKSCTKQANPLYTSIENLHYSRTKVPLLVKAQVRSQQGLLQSLWRLNGHFDTWVWLILARVQQLCAFASKSKSSQDMQLAQLQQIALSVMLYLNWSELPICRIEIGNAGDGHAVSQSRKSCLSQSCWTQEQGKHVFAKLFLLVLRNVLLLAKNKPWQVRTG